MASFNKVILIGNLTAHPELKQTASGLSVCSFNIAVNRRTSKDGEQACDFITIVAWRQTAEFVAKYFTKGKPILVCGQIQTRSYQDSQGNKRTATEVVADGVSFVESAADKSTEPIKAEESGIVGAHVAAKAAKATMPSAYTDTPSNYEEIPNDGDLPF